MSMNNKEEGTTSGKYLVFVSYRKTYLAFKKWEL